jgi:hypothetical protein
MDQIEPAPATRPVTSVGHTPLTVIVEEGMKIALIVIVCV